MTREHLEKILKAAGYYNEGVVSAMYKEPYPYQPIPTSCIKAFLSFRPDLFGYEFDRGAVNCAGVEIVFKSSKYVLRILPFYHYGEIHNSVLMSPVAYKEEHYRGRNSISQRGCTIVRNQDFIALMKRIEKRFPM